MAKQKRRSTNRPSLSPVTTFWHGGVPGITSGWITPPAERSSLWSSVRDIPDDPSDPHKVYVTTNRDWARAFAILNLGGRGALYRVEPQPWSSLEFDPDFRPPLPCYSAKRARILEVEEPEVALTREEGQKIVRMGRVWEDGSFMYDEGGYLLPDPILRQHGVTPEQCRHLGKWVESYRIRLRQATGEVYLID